QDIQPILEKSCLKCHNAEKAKGKLLLDTREHALKDGENGPNIIVSNSATSSLIHFTARLVPDSEMPPIGKGDPLPPEQLRIMRAWIDIGLKWPQDIVLRAPTEPGEKTTQAEAASLPPAATRKIDFIKDVQPIFAARCYECHSEKKQEAQFRLDAKEIALKGG